MDLTLLTDTQIKAWLTCEKRVENPGARNIEDFQHIKKDYQLLANDFPDLKFTLFYRQHKTMADSFTVGLRIHFVDGSSAVLVRFNGYSHPHPNHLDGTKIDHKCHIHKAVERYISRGYKTDSWAYETTAYNTVDGALAFAISECHIVGMKDVSALSTNQATPDLFGPQ